MATKSIIGTEDDETECVRFDEHLRRQRKKKGITYKRKCTDAELMKIRLTNLNRWKE